MSALEQQLSHLSSHERAFAQAQIARAEAVADLAAAVVGRVRRIADAFLAAIREHARSRTRRWPHAQRPEAIAEFPSIGLQH